MYLKQVTIGVPLLTFKCVTQAWCDAKGFHIDSVIHPIIKCVVFLDTRSKHPLFIYLSAQWQLVKSGSFANKLCTYNCTTTKVRQLYLLRLTDNEGTIFHLCGAARAYLCAVPQLYLLLCDSDN